MYEGVFDVISMHFSNAPNDFLDLKDFQDTDFIVIKSLIWCREGESNPHEVAFAGFWVPCVYQFRHPG